MRNLYSVLGVSQKAKAVEIKSSFRNLVKVHHPDLRAGDTQAQQCFREIVEAYECLSDSEARRRYDALLANDRAQARRRLARSAVTMLVAFALTSGTGICAAIWLRSPRSADAATAPTPAAASHGRIDDRLVPQRAH